MYVVILDARILHQSGSSRQAAQSKVAGRVSRLCENGEMIRPAKDRHGVVALLWLRIDASQELRGDDCFG